MDKGEKFDLIQEYVDKKLEDAEPWKVDDWARLYLTEMYECMDSDDLVEMVKGNYPDWFDEEE